MTSFADFQSRVQTQGQNPEAAATLFVEAMTVAERDPELAEQMLCLLRSNKDLDADASKPSGYRFRRTDESLSRLLKDRNIARSLAGGTHQRNYDDFDPSNLRIKLDKNYSPKTQGVGYPSEGKAKYFIFSGGADSPRPLTLACNNSGYWKVLEFSSLTVGVRKPAKAVGDF